jgi:hypothetical protein
MESDREILSAFETYWVSRGRLMAGEYPGSVDGEDARPKLRRLLKNCILMFVDLTEAGELEPYHGVLVKEAHHIDAHLSTSDGQLRIGEHPQLRRCPGYWTTSMLR